MFQVLLFISPLIPHGSFLFSDEEKTNANVNNCILIKCILNCYRKLTSSDTK